MRFADINAYVLHARPYQEKRAIYDIFCYEYGKVSAIGKKGLPLFTPFLAQISGKKDLKTLSDATFGFSKIFCDSILCANTPDVLHQKSLTYVRHLPIQYSGLYLNELLYKLSSPFLPTPLLWLAYHRAIAKLYDIALLLASCQINTTDIIPHITSILRCFECALFFEHGASIDFLHTKDAHAIKKNCTYEFIAGEGFCVCHKPTAYSADILQHCHNWQNNKNTPIVPIAMRALNQIYRRQIDFLLEYKPLQSRILWQNLRHYAA